MYSRLPSNLCIPFYCIIYKYIMHLFINGKSLCSFQLDALFPFCGSLAQSFHGIRAGVMSVFGFNTITCHLFMVVLHFFIISPLGSSAIFSKLLIHCTDNLISVGSLDSSFLLFCCYVISLVLYCYVLILLLRCIHWSLLNLSQL